MPRPRARSHHNVHRDRKRRRDKPHTYGARQAGPGRNGIFGASGAAEFTAQRVVSSSGAASALANPDQEHGAKPPSAAAPAPATPDQEHGARPSLVSQKPDSVAALALWAGRAATPATEPDWTGALAMLTWLKDNPESVEPERASLDKLATAILTKTSSGSLSSPLLDTALALAELREATEFGDPRQAGIGDPYQLLSIARGGDTTWLDPARRERLAAAFLAANLPWSATGLLDPIKPQLDDAGRKTLAAAMLALRIIRDDAASVAPGKAPYHGLSPIGTRLLDLLGVPVVAFSLEDPESEPTPELAEEVHKSNIGADRQRLRGPALLKILFGAARQQPVESEFKVTGARLEPKRAAANSPIVASLSRLMHRSGADAATVAADAGVVARFVRGNIYHESGDGESPFVRGTDSSALPLFTGSMPFRGGLVIQFDVTTDKGYLLPDQKLVVIAVWRGSAGVDLYSVQFDTGPFAMDAGAIDLPNSGAQIVLSTAVGSGHFLYLYGFDPATGRLWQLGEDFADGGYSLLRFGAGVPFAFLVSSADDQRFQLCMHCPSRRLTTLVRFNASTRSYAAVASGAQEPMCPAEAVSALWVSARWVSARIPRRASAARRNCSASLATTPPNISPAIWSGMSRPPPIPSPPATAGCGTSLKRRRNTG
jgi:hypothetical protein